MRERIENIIRNIQVGLVFDSHYVIDTLIKDHSDDYFRLVANYADSDGVAARAHGGIAKIIATFQGDLVKKLGYQSYSNTIHEKPNPCALWERI